MSTEVKWGIRHNGGSSKDQRPRNKCGEYNTAHTHTLIQTWTGIRRFTLKVCGKAMMMMMITMSMVLVSDWIWIWIWYWCWRLFVWLFLRCYYLCECVCTFQYEREVYLYMCVWGIYVKFCSTSCRGIYATYLWKCVFFSQCQKVYFIFFKSLKLTFLKGKNSGIIF